MQGATSVFHPQRPTGVDARFVGRSAEMDVVAEALDALRGGVGGFIQIVGEAGIGKTRMLGAVREAAAARGIEVLAGRAAEFEQRMPFQILLEALQGYGGLGKLD